MMEALVSTAARFHTRPSTLLAIADPVLALNFDLAGTVVLNRLEREAAERAAEE